MGCEPFRRYRNVAICARVQVSSGENDACAVPFVICLPTAQSTASA